MQCLSGTGSLRVGAEFLKKHYNQVKLFFLKMSLNEEKDITSDNLLMTFYTAYDLHSITNLGKPSQNIYDGWFIC